MALMGMFDEVICEAPLPDSFAGTRFQTKCFDCTLEVYVIRATGSLERRVGPHWEPLAYHGILNFYAYDRAGLAPLAPHDEARWREYDAKFTDGRLVEITVVPARRTPSAERSPESASTQGNRPGLGG